MTAIKTNSLANLSDTQIIKRLDTLVRKERQTTLDVLCHIIEMDRRSLYLGRGYASLYEYCTRHLGYSESAASRRIKTARCIRGFPEVYGMLSKNELNLSTVSKLSGILNQENKKELLDEVCFQSARQVDIIIARFKPLSLLRESVRPVYIKKSPDTPAPDKTTTADKNISEVGHESGRKFTADVGGRTFTTCKSNHQHQKMLEQKFKLEFAVNPAFMEKLEETKALLSKKYPRGVSFEQLFEVIMDEYLEKHSPKRRNSKRAKRKAIDNNTTKTSTGFNKTNMTGPDKQSRHIPAAIQDKVFARDKGRCAYISKDGVRCNSTWNLQIDHIKPYAKGGNHTIKNLRLLCAGHNQFEAERMYGKEFMNRRIHEARIE
jgi:hypothetical protein